MSTEADGTSSGKVTDADRAAVAEFIEYIDATPTPFHLVKETAAR